MDYWCRLSSLGNSSTASGIATSGALITVLEQKCDIANCKRRECYQMWLGCALIFFLGKGSDQTEPNVTLHILTKPQPKLTKFCFLLIEFHCTFPFLIKYYRILFIIIVFWLGCDRPSGLLLFVPALLLSAVTPLFLPSSFFSLSYFVLAVPMRECLGKLLHEFPMSYSHTEWYLPFSRGEIVYRPKLRLSNQI